jgi:uncharacterized protein YjdB
MDLKQMLVVANRDLKEALTEVAVKVKTIFVAGAYSTNDMVGYHLVSTNDNEARLSWAVFSSDVSGSNLAAKVSVAVQVATRRGRGTFILPEGSDTGEMLLDANCSFDDIMASASLCAVMMTALAGNTFPGTVVSHTKTITYTFAEGTAATLAAAATLQLTHSPAAPGSPTYNSDNKTVATVNGTGLITAVAVGEAYIRSSLGAMIKITVTP